MDDFHNCTRTAITRVPLRLCERQTERIYASLIETVGRPAKQAPINDVIVAVAAPAWDDKRY